MQHLQPNTILQGGKYRIERVLGQGGFGNTYVGVNTVFNERVAIKEFFMRGVTLREDDQVTVSISVPENRESFKEQKEKFKKEALRIRLLKNEHIIGVQDFFEENGTAYYVMDYVDGENLAERLKKTGRPMTESEVRIILPQILDALKAVHAEKMWHLDLKPANIMLEKGGKVKLIDFGASKQLNAQKGGATTSTAISYTNGYAPREQMEQNYDKFGPWTDIYALGATLYNLLTNKRPPLPSDIDDDESADKHQSLPFPDGIGDEMKKLVLLLMHTNRKKRPQSVDELLSEGDKLIKSEDHPNISIEDKVVAPLDSKETIIASSIGEETIVEQRPKQIDEKYSELASANYFSTESDAESEDKDSGMSNGTKIILAILIGIIVIFTIVGTRGCGNDAQESVVHQVEKNDSKKVTLMQYETAIGECQYTGPVDTDNRPNGRGEAFFNDGRYYKGGFNHGVLKGDNCYFEDTNKDYFYGEFRNNSFYLGKYTYHKDGSYFNGCYSKMKPYSGAFYDKKGKLIKYLGR